MVAVPQVQLIMATGCVCRKISGLFLSAPALSSARLISVGSGTGRDSGAPAGRAAISCGSEERPEFADAQSLSETEWADARAWRELAAVRVRPDEWSAYRVRARAYFDLGRFAETIKDCDIALRKHHEDSLAYHLRGLAHAAQGGYEQAIKDFGRAIRYEPQIAAFYRDRANSLESLGRHEDANRDRAEAIRRDPFSTQS